MAEIAETYTLPVILSFRDTAKQAEKDLGSAFKGVGKKAGKDLAKGAGEGLKELEAEVASAAKSYEKLHDKAKDALGKVRVEEEKLVKARSSGKSDAIAAAEERLAKARRDSGRATRDAADGHTVLLRAQKRLGDGADDTGRKMGRLSSVAGRAGTALAGAGAIAGGAALTGIAALAAGVLVAGNRLYDLGAQFDDLSDNLQVKTGLSGSALDQLTESVERLGTTNVPSSFAEIGDIAAEVTRNLHLTGPEFDAVTSRLANLARMGQDVDVRSLGKAFRGFGVDAKSQAPALNSLYEASTKSGLSIDDLTAAVVKGGPALRQLGLDFGESAALVATFEEAGLDGEKAMTALTKAAAYFAKEGIPAEEGLSNVIGRIQELGDLPEAGELANKVFGAKGGAAFLEAIQNGTLDLQQLQSSLQLTGIDINQVSDDTADWSEKWQDLKNELAVALEPVATPFFDAVNDELEGLAASVVANKDVIVDALVTIAEVGITSVEFLIGTMGDAARDLGSFLEPIGDVLGAMNRFQAWQADIRGDHDTADELRAQADEFFSLGEGLQEFGDKVDNFSLEKLRDAIHNIGDDVKDSDEKIGWWADSAETAGENAGTAATEVGKLDTALGNLAKAPPPPSWWTTVPTGQPPGTQPGAIPGVTTAPGIAPPSLPDLGSLAPGGGGRGVGINLQIAAANGGSSSGGVPRKVGSDSGLMPQTIAVKDQISSQFGDITDIGGWRPPDGYNEHSSGRAIDVMIPNWSTPQGQAYGDQVTASALKNPNVQYVLWRQTQWNSDGTSKPMSDRGSPTQNHMDHAHVYTYADTGTHPTGTPQTYSTSSGSTTSMPGAGGSTTMALSAGTPGYNEEGEPGYYVPDQKDIRESQQRVDDQNERVREADEAARQARIARDELDIDASQAEKDAAEERIRKADYDSQVARRELEDTKGELGEAQRGAFQPGKKGRGGAQGQRGGSELGALGSIAGSFLKETFGFGDFLPALDDLLPVQIAGTLLDTAIPMLAAYQSGEWQPGGLLGDALGTSGAPFGMPSVGAPPMPAPGVHAGTGMPGPGNQTSITIDQSINGNVGSDPEQVRRERDAGLARAIPRIPVGS